MLKVYNALVTVDTALGRATCYCSRAQRQEGPRENTSRSTTLTTFGAEPYQTRVPEKDATVVERLRSAGAVLIAKLSMGALAQGGLWFKGMTKTPWNTKHNKASPKLFLACAGGDHIKKAQLTCRKAGKDQQEFLVVKFEDLLVSSYQAGGSAQAQIIPQDQISLNFAKIEVEYKEQKPDGSLGSPVKAGWSLKENKKI